MRCSRPPRVDGVYDKDPKRFDDAKRFDRLTFEEALQRGLAVMDATAMTLCRENDLPIVVFDLFESGNMARVVRGEDLGTWLRNE
jgi:uridylate kinase